MASTGQHRDFMLRVRAAAILAMGLGFSFSATLCTSNAQQQAKMYRIGYLTTGTTASDRTPHNCPVHGQGSHFWQALLEGLQERGYVQDQNLVIECRYTEGQEERAPALAAELVSLKVDLLLAFSTPNVRAAKQATSTIPIIMVGVANPQGRGIVDSLARPGGNVTGPALDAGLEIVGKRLQLLKDAIPQVSRVAVLAYETQPPESVFLPNLEAAAAALHVRLQLHRVHKPEELESAFATMTKDRVEALLVMPGPFMWTHRQRIVELAARNRLPAVYPERDHVEAGGLLAYDIDQLTVWRRVGYYVDKIFKGAKPADLPVERPTKFLLVINLKTAKALGLTIPQLLLAQADEVIQ